MASTEVAPAYRLLCPTAHPIKFKYFRGVAKETCLKLLYTKYVDPGREGFKRVDLSGMKEGKVLSFGPRCQYSSCEGRLLQALVQIVDQISGQDQELNLMRRFWVS